MTNSATPDLDPHRLSLLKAKFGRFLAWEPPGVRPTVGPFDPSVFCKFDAERRQLIADCSEKLRQYDDAEIARILGNTGGSPNATQQGWSSFRSREIKIFAEREPPWYAGGFGHPDFAADFQNWCKMPKLSIAETLSLSVGIEPHHFPQKSLETMKKGWHGLEGTLRFLLMRYEQLNRRFDPDAFGWDVRPRDLLAWADQVHFELHPEFRRLLTRFHRGESNDGDPAIAKSRTDKREVDKIAQLFAAMAIECLGYVPNAAKSPVTKEICELAASMGISISDDTVRKYLKHGCSFIAKDWKPN